MSRHTKSNNVVFLTVLLKLVRVVALMTVEDQQAITTNSSGLCMLLEMPNPIYTLLICCLTVFSNSDNPVGWKSTILIPRCKMVFPCNNYKWRNTPPLRIDTLDYCNTFSIPWLYFFCVCTSVRACYNHCS